jgi:hypothetical protein
MTSPRLLMSVGPPVAACGRGGRRNTGDERGQQGRGDGDGDVSTPTAREINAMVSP